MNNRISRLIQSAVLALDIVSLNALAMLTWYKLDNVHGRYRPLYLRFWIVINVSWIVITWISRLYDRKRIESFEALLRGTTRNYVYWVAMVMFYLFFAHRYELSRIYVAIVLVGYCIILFSN